MVEDTVSTRGVVVGKVDNAVRNEFSQFSKVDSRPATPGAEDPAGRLGGSVGNIETEDVHTRSREVLKDIADGAYYERLSKLSREESIREWGVPKNEAEFQQNLKTWSESMDSWWAKLSPSQKTGVAGVLRQFGIEEDVSKIDWIAVRDVFYASGKPDIRKYIDTLKRTPGIERQWQEARALAGIFGKEVSEELFGGEGDEIKAWAQHNDQRKEWAERAFRDGRITEQQRDKFVKHIDAQKANRERIYTFNGLKFEGLSLEQQNAAKEVLAMLPPELLTHIKVIKLMVKERGGAMAYCGRNKYKEGEVEISAESFGYDRPTFQRKVLHEIGGHGLRDMVGSLDREATSQIVKLWSETLKAHPGLIRKDTYAKDITTGKVYPDQERFGGIMASADEFWSDRMAEYWYRKASIARNSSSRVSSNRDEDNPFTDVEETAVREVCRRTEEIWRGVMAKNKLNLS